MTFLNLLNYSYVPVFILVSVKFYKKLWNPIFLFTIMFVFATIFASSNITYDNKNIEKGISWIAIGMFLFVISFFSTQLLVYGKIHRNNIYVYKLSAIKLFSTLCILCACGSFIISLYSVTRVTSNIMEIFTNSTVTRLKYLARNDGLLVSLLGVFFSVHYYIFLVFVILSLSYKLKYSRTKFFIVIVIQFLISIITMSKDVFLINLIFIMSEFILMIPNVHTEVNFYKKYGSFFLFMVFFLLFIIAIQRGYLGSRYDNYLQAIFGTIYEYVGVSVQCFGELVSSENIEFTGGVICFRPFINILSHLGLCDRISIFQDVIGNSKANVYTVFGNMYRDFGFFGIVTLSVLFGSFLGVFYTPNYTNNSSRMTVNSIILMTMFFGYFDLKIIQTIYPTIIIYSLVFEKIFFKRIYINHERL